MTESKGGVRTSAQNFEIAGTQFLTLSSFAKKVGRPVAVIRSWTKRPTNPLPTVKLPSAIIGADGQSSHVEEPVALEWVRAHASNAPKARKPGRPRKNGGAS